MGTTLDVLITEHKSMHLCNDWLDKPNLGLLLLSFLLCQAARTGSIYAPDLQCVGLWAWQSLDSTQSSPDL